MQIGGASYNLVRWPQPIVSPAIDWEKAADKNWYGSDRGASEDIFESKVRFFDTTANIESLQSTLESNRGAVTLSSFEDGQEIFGPEVDYSGTISATVIGPARPDGEGSVKNENLGMASMTLNLRATDASLLGTTASLSTLRLQNGWSGDKNFNVSKVFSHDQTLTTSDFEAENGVFKATFAQTTEESKAIISYFLTTGRSNSVSFPSLAGITYPFGRVRGALPKSMKIMQWSAKRINQVFWEIKVKWVEHA